MRAYKPLETILSDQIGNKLAEQWWERVAVDLRADIARLLVNPLRSPVWSQLGDKIRDSL